MLNIHKTDLVSGPRLTIHESTLIEAIDQGLEKTADRNIVFYEVDQLSGRGISDKAHRVAVIIKRMIGEHRGIIAVNLPRSVELLAVVIAVLRLGCAYLPLSKDQPEQRNLDILEDAKPILVIGGDSHSQVYTKNFAFLNVSCIDFSETLGPVHYPDVSPSDVCYVMYTSGSTGKPKGVPITQAGILNRLAWMRDYYGFLETDALIQKAPLSFDVSIYEMCFPLMTGARLIICPPNRQMDIDYLIDLVQRHQVTYLQFVPQLLRAFINNPRARKCRTVRHLMSSGDALDIHLARACWHTLPSATLYNGYGPTECSIGVCHWEFEEREGLTSPPLGFPTANISVVIVDNEIVCQKNQPGELWITGAQLSPGYINSEKRPNLNEAFIEVDVVGIEHPQRFYRTGDLVRLNDYEEIEFLGRVDYQIKVNGVRIELEEIESVANSFAGIERSVAVFDSDAVTLLYEVKKDASVEKNALLQHCLAHLPPLASPARLIERTNIALSSNGKIDRRAAKHGLNASA